MFKFYEKCFFGFAIVAVFLAAGYQGVSAQSSSATTTAVVSAQVVATVEIYSAEIISQQGNQFKLSFDFFNQKGVQPGIKYAVQLLKIDADGRQTLVDEFVYPEVYDLKEGETKKMTIFYTAPEYLQGEFSLWLASKNSSGLSLAFSNLGKIKLNGSGEFVEILSETCFLTIGTTATTTIACQVINHLSQDIKATAQIQTFLGASFGGEVAVENAQQNEAVEIKAKQQIEISLSLPKPSVPQTYEAQFWLMADNKSVSNKAIFRYTVAGPSATIENIIFDKEFYKKGETAQIQFLWFTAGDQSAGQISFIIKDKQGQPCSAIINQSLNQQASFLTVAVPIIRDCAVPKIEATIQDQAGHILDSKTLAISAKPATTTSLTGLYSRYKKIIVLAIVILILLLAFIIIIIRKKKLGKSGFLFFIFSFVICFNFLFSLEASAATVEYGICRGEVFPCPTVNLLVTVRFTDSLNKSVYSSGENAMVTEVIQVLYLSNEVSAGDFTSSVSIAGFPLIFDHKDIYVVFGAAVSNSVTASIGSNVGSFTATFTHSATLCSANRPCSYVTDNYIQIPYTVVAPACIPLGGSTCQTLANCCTTPFPAADTCQGGKCCISSPSIACTANNQCCSGYCNAQGKCGCTADGYACPASPGYCCSYCNSQTNKCGSTSCTIDGLPCPPSGVCCSFCNSQTNQCGPNLSTCSNDCSFGQKQCVTNNTYRACGNYDTDSCFEWSSNFSCPTGLTCSGNGDCSGGSPSPPCANECSTDICENNTTYRTCGNYDADTCLELSFANSCPTGLTCSGNGACSGPPSLGYISVLGKIGYRPIKLNLIPVTSAQVKGTGVAKLLWPIFSQTFAAADLVLPDDPDASPVRVMTKLGARAWKKHWLSTGGTLCGIVTIGGSMLCQYHDDCCSKICSGGVCSCKPNDVSCIQHLECCTGYCSVSSNTCACIPAGEPLSIDSCNTGYSSTCCSGLCDQPSNKCR